MFKVAVFISGRGTNLSALIEYFRSKKDLVEFILVVSDKKNAYGLITAQENDIDTFNLDKTEESYQKLLKLLKDKDCDLIVLAGFLKLIPAYFIKEFENKIINIHPALLPSFGGAGMYGMNVHKAVFAKSCKVSGATVHFVNENYDEGLIIDQVAVDIRDAKSADEIAAKVLEIEHELLPKVVEKIALNKIIIEDKRVLIL